MGNAGPRGLEKKPAALSPPQCPHRSRRRKIWTTWTVGALAHSDVLDDFQQKPASAAPPSESAAPSTTEAEPKAESGEGDAEDPLSDEFVKELTKNMESFMAQLGGQAGSQPPAAGAESGQGSQAVAEDEMMKQFERMLAGQGAGDKEPETKKEAPNAPASDASFQDVIQATMEKLRQSSVDASNASSSGGNPFAGLGLDGNGDLAQMLEALGGAGGGGEMPELTQMLSSMMEELMNKEVLYEPLKDMHSRFPAYFDSEAGKKLSEEEKSRYKKQEAIMGEIIGLFEAKDYSDKDAAKKKRVGDLVAEMQELGSPPQELLGDMPPELAGLNGMLGGEGGDDNCSIM